ncbi:DoxX family membrane protein [Catalinimonas niigatensis]|uniref:DoxX family membrane protein n=1 Tax=Catalinimonas niigatensis TaxID=1397264 RepID=UPI002666C1D0|nr:DoxX family membrane protein [Catalinimonas niigatensis]WPP53027.1 DoxX family membrane protein [Catalinimonas niigatensis]
MKIAVTIIRILMGLIFLFSSIVVLFDLVPKPELEGGVRLFNEGMEAAVYLMPLIKVVELICAIAFITGFFVPLATVVVFPIVVNILLFHGFLAPEGLPIAIFLLLGNLLLAYYYRNYYAPLLLAKAA